MQSENEQVETVVILTTVALLALLVFALSGMLLTAFRDIRHLRDVSGILDRPLDLELGSVVGQAPSKYGLPDTLDTTNAVVVFLSTKCGTCRAIAAGFDRTVSSLPAGLWIVLEGRNEIDVNEMLESSPLKRLSNDGRVLVDINGSIAQRIGLNTTPVGFRVDRGKLASATTVPSSRYLRSILPKPIQLQKNYFAPEVTA